MLTLYYATNTCALASAYRARRSGRGVRNPLGRLRRRRADQARVSQDQSERPGAGAGHRARRADRNARHSRLYRANSSCRSARAARRAVRLRRAAGVQRLSLRNGACRACPSRPRLPVGGRSGGVRGDEEEGPAVGRRLFRADREGDAAGPMGHGRAPIPSPTPISSPSPAGWRSTASTRTPSRACSTTATGWPNARPSGGRWPARGWRRGARGEGFSKSAEGKSKDMEEKSKPVEGNSKFFSSANCAFSVGYVRFRPEILSFSAHRPALAEEYLSGTPTIARLLIFRKKKLAKIWSNGRSAESGGLGEARWPLSPPQARDPALTSLCRRPPLL